MRFDVVVDYDVRQAIARLCAGTSSVLSFIHTLTPHTVETSVFSTIQSNPTRHTYTRRKHTIYPPVDDVFTALNLTPLSNVKVVIVGQDPYHGPKQAHGLCFSIRRDAGIPPPPSLRNIYKELIDDPCIPNFTTKPNHGCLVCWAQQGVLMINTVLTVRQGQANSHKNKGWEDVTDAVLRAVRDRDRDCDLDDDGQNNKKGVVFLLWGKPATEKTQTILNRRSGGGSSSSRFFKGRAAAVGKSSNTTTTHENQQHQQQQQRHKIIATSHPSPLGATKTTSPFLGSRCFSRANDMLIEMGHEPIDWRVD
jgi:uracil-DNA glycosylase